VSLLRLTPLKGREGEADVLLFSHKEQYLCKDVNIKPTPCVCFTHVSGISESVRLLFYTYI